MKKILLSALVLSLAFLPSCQTTSYGKLLKKKSLNGMEVLTFNDEGSHFASLILWFPEGYAHERKGEFGSTKVMGDLLAKGSRKTTGQEFQDALSALGSSIGFSVGAEESYLSAKVLAKDAKSLVLLVSDMMLYPAFRDKDFKKLLSDQVTQIKQIEDSPSSLSSWTFKKTIFDSHPYGRSALGSKKDLSTLKLQELKERFQSFVDPAKIKLVLAGNWPKDAEALLISNLSEIEKRTFKSESLRMSSPEHSKKSILYHKPSLKQAQVAMGLASLSRSHPDYVPFRVGLFALGGTFRSRLNEELRIRRGLTYGVSSYLNPFSQSGLLKVSGAVRQDKLAEFIYYAKQVLAKTQKEGISQGELDRAKAIIKGQFPKALETAEQEAYSYLSLLSKGVEGKELYRYLDKVAALSLNEVNDALRSHLKVQDMSLNVVGDKRQISPKIKWSEVKKLNVN